MKISNHILIPNRNIKNIALIGFMGAGKTSVGYELSKGLDCPFFDIDHEIFKHTGLDIASIFERFGEDCFRQLETRFCKKASQLQNIIISTGGGLVLRKKNISALKTSCIIFYLQVSADTILERLKDDTSRPLLNSAWDTETKMSKMQSLMKLRIPIYEDCADYIINGNLSISQVAENIKKNLNDIGGNFYEQIGSNTKNT